MTTNQFTGGARQRLMYVDSKEGLIDGAPARIGWVRYSKTGRSVCYRGLNLHRANGRGIRGNFVDETGAGFWVSGVKQRGTNVHPAEHGVAVVVDEDAVSAWQALRSGDDHHG